MFKNNLKRIYFILNILLKKKIYFKNISKNNYLTILNLHRVSPDKNPFYPSLSPQLFEELLKFVTKEFNVITFREIEKYKNSKKPNLILSFDDGFYDFLEYAMPILEKYNVAVNQNVIPSVIESGKPVWDVKLGDILNQVPINRINQINLPNFKIELTLKNKAEFGLLLTHYLKQRAKREREPLWEKIETIAKEEQVQFTKMLNRNDIIEISKIHEIGAHSYSHESMGIESNTFFQKDFYKCQKYFQEKLNLPINIYAFPSGSYRKEQIAFLIKNNIKHILLVEEEYSTLNTNIHKRFTFYANSIAEMKIRALGWHR
jgi:peptidoglycan/xylan/chitin deacetylase (PgdA/CDA1 family)